MASQYIMVGNCYTIDLDRFVSASVEPGGVFSNDNDCLLVIRLRGSGFLRFLKYSYYRINYKSSQEAVKDMKTLMDAVNRWQISKPKKI